MRSIVFAMLLGLSLPALADDGFAARAAGAEKLPSLRRFLEQYVGSCTSKDRFDQQDCKRNAERRRRSFTNKAFVVTIADTAQQLSAGTCSDEGCPIHLVPFFDGGGLALSKGAPKGKDARDNPVLDLVQLWSDEELDELDLRRLLRSNMISVKLVFRPEGVWQLKRRDGSLMEGARARFVAVQLQNVRTGDVLASRTF